MTPKAKQSYEKLSKLSGTKFDREFLQTAVKDHRKDISEYRQEAKAGSGPASQLTSKQLPVLEKHLRSAESLESGKQTSTL